MWGSIPKFTWRDSETPRTVSVKISVSVEFRTEHIPNENQKLYN
jgi:hypothetical protein